MSYKYDVFISYSHNEAQRWWVQSVFLDRFEAYLTNALGWTPEVFSDRTGIESGDAWPERLKSALAYSKVLVPIWSVEYFESSWCKAECAVIRYRAQKLAYGTLGDPRGLIHPVRLYDGQHYPTFAKKTQSKDFNRFNRVGKAFLDTSTYLDLQDELEEWTNHNTV
jgi:hypothetical protein